MRLSETPVVDVDEISNLLVSSLPLCDCPYAFVGTSVGGIIAYETVRKIEEKMLPKPSALVVIAAPAPQQIETDLAARIVHGTGAPLQCHLQYQTVVI